MRLLITAVVNGDPIDLAIDAEEEARVSDVAQTLGQSFHVNSVTPGTTPTLRVVGDAADPAPAPDLFVDEVRLDPAQRLLESPLRHGSLVGVGAPVNADLIEPKGLVEVRISSGMGAGGVFRLDPGEYTIGTTADCDIVLTDQGLPAHCARIFVNSTGEVDIEPDAALIGQRREAPRRRRPLDGPIVLGTKKRQMVKKPKPGMALPEGTITVQPSEPVPLIHTDRVEIVERRLWPRDSAVVIGDELLELRDVAKPDASISPNPAGITLDYNRPPRLLPAPRATSFTLPSEPKVPEKPPFPLAMMFIPAAMGIVMFVVTKNPLTLMMIAFSPLMALANWITGRKQGKSRFRQEFTDFAARTERIQNEALDALQEERSLRRRDYADPAEVLMIAVGPRARLWERRRSDPDFLMARVGTADQPSEISVTDPQRESHQGPLIWTAPDVPVAMPLAEVGITGIAGALDVRMSLARWLVGQIAVLHSPADVDMMLLTDADKAEHWQWIRWLPHMRSDLGDSELAQLGVDDESTAMRINELHQELQRRRAAMEDSSGSMGGRKAAFDPMLIILDGARRLRLLGGVPELLQAGPSAHMFFLCLDEDERLLPEECRGVINAVPGDFQVRVSGRATVEGVRPDQVTSGWAEMVARALAPIRDVSDVAAGGSLPGASRLLNVIRLDPPTADDVLERWSSVGRTTEAIIGEGADGPFSIDMRKDGPHGLVAGTTGSGKSELLQTIIASLAVNNRPDEMNYVLIDYKGGAAFKDCNHLPHTVGMVTDLDGHLTTRALESLGAELHRREHQLANADAKDIEDYLAAKGPDDEPMPRLLIVIDEFAAMVTELPDFVTGLVDIARRGRSLGVHLILATQRPAGVVSAEIKSNTNLRIALRVTDKGDSQDVIEAGDAAEIQKSTPGRAYARLGHSSLIPFQSSRVGGRPRGEDATAEISLRPLTFDQLGTPEAAKAQQEEDINVLTDLAALVKATQEASEKSGIVSPPSPWLEALPDVLTLDELLAEFPKAEPSTDNLAIPFGMVDIPSKQARDAAVIDLTKGGHLSIISAPRAGRSTVLRAIAGAIGRFTSPADVHVYGVDCGNNALLPLVGLPHVGAVVTRDQTDRMDRLVGRLRGIITQRQQDLAMGGFADVTEQRSAVAPEKRLPYIVVLFDRWEGFFQAYDGLDGGRLVEAWQQILQEGAAVGIRIIMTGDRTLTLGRLSTLFDDKLMMRMVDMHDFSTIGMTTKQTPASMTEGRGFRAEGLRETQVVLLTEDPAGTAQVAALQTIGRDATEEYAELPREQRPFRLDVLPVRMELDEALALPSEPLEDSTLVVGVGGDTLSLRTLDAFHHGPGIIVTGPRRTGRSTVLRTMATFALRTGWKVVVVTPRQSPLREMCNQEGVFGPFDENSDETELRGLLEELTDAPEPVLVLVDDVELVGADGWLPTLLADTIDDFRDSGSVLVGAGTPSELGGLYRGPVVALKRSGSGVMLAPQTSADTDIFGARIARSALGAALPPGGGFIVRTAQIERIQVIWPE